MNVLVIDDHRENATLLASLLEQRGINVSVALDEDDAYRHFKHRYNVIVADIVMPGGKSGVSIARDYVGAHPETKVCVFSGHPERREYKDSCLAFDKSPDGLRSLVNEVVSLGGDRQGDTAYVLIGRLQALQREIGSTVQRVGWIAIATCVGSMIGGLLVAFCVTR